MVYEGLPLEQAAERGGLKPTSLRVNMRQQHIRAFYNQCLADLRQNGPAVAYATITKQMHDARSERLQFDAARWVAGVDGLSPVTKVEGKHDVMHRFDGFDYSAVDGTAQVIEDEGGEGEI